MTIPTPIACSIKGCKARFIHHHYSDGVATEGRCPLNYGDECLFVGGAWTAVAPRGTKSARIAALTAENAALIAGGKADAAMIASLKALLAVEAMKAKPPTVSVEPWPGIDGAATVRINGKHAGMVFGDYPGRRPCHATAKWLGPGSFHSTQAEAVAAIVAAWKRAQR